MIGRLLVSHGGLAGELVRTAQRILGRPLRTRALCLSWAEGCERAEEAVRRGIESVEEGEGVLVLVDMFGDTPCNAALSQLEPGRVELVSGANLPMLVRLETLSESQSFSLSELAEWCQDRGRHSVQIGSQVRAASMGRTVDGRGKPDEAESDADGSGESDG